MMPVYPRGTTGSEAGGTRRRCLAVPAASALLNAFRVGAAWCGASHIPSRVLTASNARDVFIPTHPPPAGNHAE